jgi:hypothetical protein
MPQEGTFESFEDLNRVTAETVKSALQGSRPLQILEYIFWLAEVYIFRGR